MSKLAESLRNQGLIGSEEAEIANIDNYTDGAGGTFVDADTIHRDGKKYRLTGFDAREVDKFDEDGNPLSLSGDLGGKEQAVAIAKLAKSGGFTELVPTSGEPDPYGRTVADLRNADGESFGDYLIKNGVVRPQGSGYFGSEETDKASAFADLARQSRTAAGQNIELDTAAAWVNEAIQEQSQYLPQFKQRAVSERQLAEAKAASQAVFADPNATAEEKAAAKRGYEQFSTQAVQFRNFDRHLNNEARNPLSASWDIGVKGAVEGATGMLELIGHELGYEELENWSAGKLEAQRYDLANAPKVLTEFKDVGGIGDFIEYTGNLAAMSLPYMALTIGGAVAAPYTGGLSLSAPAAVYGGQVWNEMGVTGETDKSASIAIGAGISMAVLDRLGIQGLVNSSLLSNAGRQRVVQELVLKKGMTQEAAESLLVNATKKETAKLAGDVALFSKDLLNSQNVVRSILANYGRGAASEGITEVGQESIAYLAAIAGGDKMYDPAEFAERLQNAAIGGAVLGGAFSVPGTAYDAGAWTDAIYRQLPADTAKQSRQSRWREEAIASEGGLKSIPELAQDVQKRADQRGTILDINSRAERDVGKKRSWSETRQEGLEAIPGLWRGQTRMIFTDELQDQSPAARILADMFGANHENTHSGATYETAKHLQVATYSNMIDTTGQLLRNFGYEGKGLVASKTELSNKLYEAYNIASDAEGNVDWDRLNGTKFEGEKALIVDFANKLQKMTDRMWHDQAQTNPELGRIENYGFRARSLNKVAIEKNRGAFVNELQSRFKLSKSDAEALTDNVLNIDSVGSIDDAFSLTEHGGFKPTAHHERTLNLADDAEFASQWMSDDIFHNISQAAKSAARYKSYQDYIGDNNSKVNELLQEVQEDLIAGGMDEKKATDLVNHKAKQLKDYFDAESGNYKRPTTQLGRNLETIQRHLMVFTTLAGLPLATFSSLVEFALVFRNLTPSQISGMSQLAGNFAESFVTDMKQINPQTEARKQLKEVGFYEWDVGAATVTGATEVNNRSKNFLQTFFRAIGLSQWTDFTRAARASFGADFIRAQMELINGAGPEVTNEVLAARDGLANLGLNVPRFTELYNKGVLDANEDAEFQEMVRLSTFNWVNDAIVLPQAANRPLFYQDPRFALFTQFHGFISTFTANHLPKLYKDAFKGKTPSMKYTAFATMATMIMLGFLSQYLKDLLKYGKQPQWLDPGDLVQRGVGASGLLGTGERVYNLFNPIYEKQYDTSIERLFGEVAGESAAITNLQRGVDAAGEAVTGDPAAAYRKGSRLIPFLGPLRSLHERVEDTVF